MISREFKLYLNAGVGVAPVINANQFDQSEEWVFTLLQSDGTVYTPSTGAIIGLKQDGTTILNAGTVNEDGQVVITETEQMTAVPGSNIFEILIDGNSHGTANFVVFVERRPGDIDNPSESDISLFQEAITAAGNVTQFQADIAELKSDVDDLEEADTSLASQIAQETSARTQQDAVLQAEIDQIIAPSGEAPSAAEVQNARIGVDGTTYDTLGDAVRGQVSDLKNALTDLTSVKSTIPLGQASNNAIALNMAVGQVVSLTPYQASSSAWRYAIVPCSEGQKVEVNLTGGSTPRAYAFIDSNNILLAVAPYGQVEDILNAPANTSKLIMQDNSGTGTAYFVSDTGRVEVLESKVEELEEKTSDILPQDMVLITSSVNNVFDPDTVMLGKNLTKTGSKLVIGENQYTTDYGVGIIDLKKFPKNSLNNLTISLKSAYTNARVLSLAVVDADMNIIDDRLGVSKVLPYSFENLTLTNAKYIYFDIQVMRQILANSNAVMVNQGTTALSYEDYHSAIEYVPYPSAITDDLDERVSVLEGSVYNGDISIHLPDEYYAVVGDTFELFYKGIINCLDPSLYYVEVTCAKGKAFKSKFIYTPALSDVGTVPITIKVFNGEHELLSEKTANIIVKNKVSSPSSEKVILWVGDSLSVDGIAPSEFYRRLTGEGGTPVADELSNLTMIGTRTGSNGAKYVAEGGYSFNSYNTANTSNAIMLITTNHDKTQADQHSIYKDTNNVQWKLETIESGQIKIIRVSASGVLPSTGTLTWVSGGDNHSNIVYTGSEQASGNPFWNSNSNEVDFSAFVTAQGESTLDYVYVLLGWNSTAVDADTYKTQVETFVNNILSDFPSCKIVLLGLEIPSLDGLGNNYTAEERFSFYWNMKAVWKIEDVYKEIAESNANVAYTQVSGQFDTLHNMQTGTRAVNTRNSQTETYQTNGVHPATSGYLQIADVAYRELVANELQ